MSKIDRPIPEQVRDRSASDAGSGTEYNKNILWKVKALDSGRLRSGNGCWPRDIPAAPDPCKCDAAEPEPTILI
jgi:hypothetical protein